MENASILSPLRICKGNTGHQVTQGTLRYNGLIIECDRRPVVLHIKYAIYRLILLQRIVQVVLRLLRRCAGLELDLYRVFLIHTVNISNMCSQFRSRRKCVILLWFPCCESRITSCG